MYGFCCDDQNILKCVNGILTTFSGKTCILGGGSLSVENSFALVDGGLDYC